MSSEMRYKARPFPIRQYPVSPPKVPDSIDVLFCAPNSAVLEQTRSKFGEKLVTSHVFYKPGLLAAARAIFRGAGQIYHERDITKVVSFPPVSQLAEWDQSLVEKWDNAQIRSAPEDFSFWLFDPSYDFSPERFDTLQEEFVQFLISNEKLEVYFNPETKFYQKIEELDEAFVARCLEKIRENHEAEMRNLRETIFRKEERLKQRLNKEVREMEDEQIDVPPHASMTTSKTRKRGNKKSKANIQAEINVQESIVNIDEIRKELLELKKQKEMQEQQYEERLNVLAKERERDVFRPNRGDIEVLRFSLVWLPYTEYVIQEEGFRRLELIKSF